MEASPAVPEGERLLKQLLRRLRGEEDGIALIMALFMLLVLTIALSATLKLTDASARNASRHVADQRAYSAAEAGINNAVAAIVKCGQGCMLGQLPTTAGDPASTVQPVGARTATYGAVLRAHQPSTINTIAR